MNNKIKLAIAVAVGIVGGGVISTLGGGESTKQLGSASLASGMEFPEWTRDGSAFRCKDENPDFDANMFLQVDPNYGPIE